MQVTQLIELNKSKCKVYIDYEFAFVLYKGELRQYNIKEGQTLEDHTYHMIREEVLCKRAKVYIMNLLQARDYTEKQLYDKLKQAFYHEDAITSALDYVKSYHYLDDSRYTAQYMESRKGRKSRKEIYYDLLKKGVAKEVINCQLEDLDSRNGEAEEIKAAVSFLKKKHYDERYMDDAAKKKLEAAMYRRGFQQDSIKRAMSDLRESRKE